MRRDLFSFKGAGITTIIALETERLTVRNFNASDWKALQHMINQYQSSGYAAYDHQWPTSDEEIRKITEWFAGGDSYLAICLKDTGQFVGFVSLVKEQHDDSGELNLGYIFNFDYHGRGYATEACRAVIGHAFNRLQAKMVVAATAAVNRPSCQLLKRLGFKQRAESIGFFKTTENGTPIEFLA